jgi:D-alanyl-D-alanine carboxypeptidase-like protein
MAEHPAYEFLKSLPRKWSGTSAFDCRTYEDKNIEALSASFAASAAAFLEAFVKTHGHVTITSAHRSAKEQACVCVGEKGPCAGKPRVTKNKSGKRLVRRVGVSRHQHGIALDVRAGTGTDKEYACIHDFARLNPQFGVQFPLGKRDRPHMEPARDAKVKVAAAASTPAPIVPCSQLKTMLTDDHLY